MTAHKDLTGSDLHEPKGIENAASGQVYAADGAGSGAWTNQADPNIHGTTEVTGPATDDEFMCYDTSAAANRRITYANHLKVVSALTEDTSPDGTADYLVTYDNSAGAAKKVLPKNLTRAGGLQLLTSGTVSAAATLDLVLTSYTGYRAYQVVLTGFQPATNGSDLQCVTSTDGGSTYASANYTYATIHLLTGQTVSQDTSTSSSSLLIADSLANASTQSADVILNLFNPASSAFYTKMSWECNYINSSSLLRWVRGAGAQKTAADVDALRFLFSSGNIDEGAYALYGYI